MDPKLLYATFKRNDAPAWRCPNCMNETLEIVADSFVETDSSATTQLEMIVCGLMKCREGIPVACCAVPAKYLLGGFSFVWAGCCCCKNANDRNWRALVCFWFPSLNYFYPPPLYSLFSWQMPQNLLISWRNYQLWSPRTQLQSGWTPWRNSHTGDDALDSRWCSARENS